MSVQRVSKPLLIGIGNRDRGDDQVGIYVAEKVGEEMGPAIDVLIHRGDPAYLIQQWENRELVIVIDAVLSEGTPEGEIFCWDVANEMLAVETAHASTHHLGVHEAIELAKALHKMPGKFYVYGINAMAYAAGQPMSRRVCAGAEKVTAEITRFLQGDNNARNVIIE